MQWREAALSMYRRSHEMEAGSVERIFALRRWRRRGDCSGGSEGRICCFGSKEDGMSELDLLLLRAAAEVGRQGWRL